VADTAMSNQSDERRADDSTPSANALPPNADLARISRHIAIGEFAASIAHEARQPLTAIIANAETCLRLLRGTTPNMAEIVSALEEIVAEGYRADLLIRRNRELLRDQPSPRVPLDINEIAREVISLAKARLQAGGIRLSTHLGTLPAVDGDRRELQHVLLNLFANAIEAMEAKDLSGRALEIVTSVTPDGHVKVVIADTGVGLDGVDLDRLFTQPYTTKTAGLGLGLATCRSIVDSHGGTLWAEQNSGQGARFCFALPQAAP
jgi:signal transduction histidine kinase